MEDAKAILTDEGEKTMLAQMTTALILPTQRQFITQTQVWQNVYRFTPYSTETYTTSLPS